jgi:hypothetical protein
MIVFFAVLLLVSFSFVAGQVIITAVPSQPVTLTITPTSYVHLQLPLTSLPFQQYPSVLATFLPVAAKDPSCSYVTLSRRLTCGTVSQSCTPALTVSGSFVTNADRQDIIFFI